MSDVMYIRPVEGVIADDVASMMQSSSGCFTMYRVHWRASFVATNGERMCCWYRAPDAEYARLALKQLGSDLNAVWPGTAPEAADDSALSLSNAVVETTIEGEHQVPQILASITAQRAQVIEHFISSDKTRLFLFVLIEESVTGGALSIKELPAGSVCWGCRIVVPEKPN